MKIIMKSAALAATVLSLAGCVVEPAPVPVAGGPPPPPYQECCYAYPAYPAPYYGYGYAPPYAYGPAIGIGVYGGGWRGGGWHGR